MINEIATKHIYIPVAALALQRSLVPLKSLIFQCEKQIILQLALLLNIHFKLQRTAAVLLWLYTCAEKTYITYLDNISFVSSRSVVLRRKQDRLLSLLPHMEFLLG